MSKRMRTEKQMEIDTAITLIEKYIIGLEGDNARLRPEKERRIYYQDIVYAVCDLLDRPEHKIVCGTSREPSTELQEAVKDLLPKTKAADGIVGETSPTEAEEG